MAALNTAGANEGGGVAGGMVGVWSAQPISRPVKIKANVKNITLLESLALLLKNKKTSSRSRLDIRQRDTLSSDNKFILLFYQQTSLFATDFYNVPIFPA